MLSSEHVAEIKRLVRVVRSAQSAISMARDTDEATEYRMELGRAEMDFARYLASLTEPQP